MSHKGLYRYSLFVAAATFFLIIMGGLVTSTGSGLAVPDWPLSFGQILPPMVGGVVFEHGHRLTAASVGFLTIALVAVFWKWEKRRWLVRLGFAALGLVILQGIFGGLTVLYKLPLPVSVAHACMGQIFFSLTVALAYFSSPSFSKPSSATPTSFFLALGALGAVFLQLVLGALVRHTGGHFLALHMANSVLALVAVQALVVHLLKNDFEGLSKTIGKILLSLVLIQMVLGLTVYLERSNAVLATGHVALGALILAATLLAVLETGKSLDKKALMRPLWAYAELTKPRVTFMVLITTVIGFILGARGDFDGSIFFLTLLGTALTAGGAAGLNMVMEKDRDAKMLRTRQRPLPQNRISTTGAQTFSVVIALAGIAILAFGVNLTTSALAGLTLATYLFAYTPLKPKTSLSTLVGAVPGAIPPMMGWTAARGTLDFGAWALFGILYLWQLPHFLAIAWLYREDYTRGGFAMLSVEDPDGKSTSRQIALYAMAIVPMAILPSVIGLLGSLYFYGALILSLAFFAASVMTAVHRTPNSAKKLFLASVIYLPCLLAVMMLDKVLLS